ncbi:uncharacterized protein METZ01_LOCUS327858, partial [marine metagenome]
MKKYLILFLPVFLWKCTSPGNTVTILDPVTACQENVVRTGLDILLEDYSDYLKGKTIGLVTNHTGISRK